MDLRSNVEKSQLVVATWNANGVRGRKGELEIFLESHNVSVMLLSETLLSKSVAFGIKGYQTFRKDRVTRGGGVAVLVKRDMAVSQISLDSELEAVGVETDIGGKRHRFIAVYVPPSRELYKEDIDSLIVGARTVIGGDLNAKNAAWGCRRTNKNGKVLGKAVREVDGLEVVAPSEATSVPAGCRVGDIVDIFLSYRMSTPWEARTHYELSSDHFPVTVRIGGDPAKAKVFTRIDWARFKIRSEKLGVLGRPIAQGSLSEVAEGFTAAVQQLLKECTVKIPTGKANALGLSKSERILVERKNLCRKAWIRWRREKDRQELRNLERDVKEMLVKVRRRKVLEQVQWSNPITGDCWKFLRALGTGGASQHAPLRDGDRLVFNKKDQAEMAADYLESVFTNDRISDRSLEIKADRIRRGLVEDRSPFEDQESPSVSADRITAIIRSRKKKSAPGEDEISYRVLSGLHPKAIESFREILSASLKYGEVPDCWKTAIIVLIPKGGKDPSRVSNRRPISLINSMAKVLETLVKEEMQEFIEENEILPPNQFGFRADLGAVHQVVNFAEAVTREIRPRRRSAVALFDLEKAYDKVWRSGLLFKLVERGFPKWITRWLGSWLENRKFRVRMDKEFSGWHPANEGLPQGSPLSPGLFNVFVSDLPHFCGGTGIQVFQFADDTAILATSNTGDAAVRKLEGAASKLIKFCDRWKMALNEDKTEVMSPGRKSVKDRVVRIGRTRVKIKRQVKYLGVIFDRHGSMVKHVKHRVGLAKHRLARMFSVLRWDSGVGFDVRKNILKMIALPSAFYGMEVAVKGSEAAREMLETAQRVLRRRCLGAPWYVPNRFLAEAIVLRDCIEVAEDRRDDAIEAMRSHRDEGVRERGENCSL